MDQILYEFERVTIDALPRPMLVDVTASIPASGITAIVGPSGSGKTTLLRLCNRLEVPTAGRVLLHGADLADLDPLVLRRKAGMVFQRPTLFGGTVADNLAVADPGASHAEMESVLERAELDGSFLSRPAAELSGGEGQRACLARTLLTDPEVVLMDEVTSSLDAKPRRGLEMLARHLADEGVPILWVTHDLDQALRMADYLIVMLEGRLRFEGEPGDLIDAEPQVAEFLAGDAHAG